MRVQRRAACPVTHMPPTRAITPHRRHRSSAIKALRSAPLSLTSPLPRSGCVSAGGRKKARLGGGQQQLDPASVLDGRVADGGGWVNLGLEEATAVTMPAVPSGWHSLRFHISEVSDKIGS